MYGGFSSISSHLSDSFFDGKNFQKLPKAALGAYSIFNAYAAVIKQITHQFHPPLVELQIWPCSKRRSVKSSALS